MRDENALAIRAERLQVAQVDRINDTTMQTTGELSRVSGRDKRDDYLLQVVRYSRVSNFLVLQYIKTNEQRKL